MAFVSNPALLSAAFIEGSAVFILLVLYTLLAPGFPAKFFRFWMTGWSLYFCADMIRIFSLWRGGPEVPSISLWISTIAAAFFLGAVLDCVGHGNKAERLVPIVAIVAFVSAALSYAKLPNAYEWTQSLLEGSLYLSAGWTLWRAQSRHRGFGWKLLAGTLLLRGLHALDRPQWTSQSMGFLGVPFQAMLGIAMGIAMVVLVLEAGHSRMEDLNEKLRRLALITAQATQSLKADEALRGVLIHLVEEPKWQPRFDFPDGWISGFAGGSFTASVHRLQRCICETAISNLSRRNLGPKGPSTGNAVRRLIAERANPLSGAGWKRRSLRPSCL